MFLRAKTSMNIGEPVSPILIQRRGSVYSVADDKELLIVEAKGFANTDATNTSMFSESQASPTRQLNLSFVSRISDRLKNAFTHLISSKPEEVQGPLSQADSAKALARLEQELQQRKSSISSFRPPDQQLDCQELRIKKN